MFYGLTKEELAGNRLLTKFLSIKRNVHILPVVTRNSFFFFFVPPFSRSFDASVVIDFDALKGRVIHL